MSLVARPGPTRQINPLVAFHQRGRHRLWPVGQPPGLGTDLVVGQATGEERSLDGSGKCDAWAYSSFTGATRPEAPAPPPARRPDATMPAIVSTSPGDSRILPLHLDFVSAIRLTSRTVTARDGQ